MTGTAGVDQDSHGRAAETDEVPSVGSGALANDHPTALPSFSLEERRFRLEERKLEEEIATKSRDHKIAEQELAVKVKESNKADPLRIAVLGGLVAVFGGVIAAGANVWVSYHNGNAQIEADERKHKLEMATEAYKAEANRILEAVKFGTPDRTACTLKFLMKGGLIETKSLRDFIDEYLASRRGGTGVGEDPSSPPTQAGATTPSSVAPDCPVAAKLDTPSKPGPSSENAPKEKLVQIIPFSTDWKDGGHNQNEACQEGIQQIQANFAGKVLRRVSSDEESRRVGFGHVEYKYYCNIGVYELRSQ